MGLVRLTIKDAGRATVRGGLTVPAVAITLVAFVLLRTLSASWTDRIAQTPNDRVVIRHKTGWAGTLRSLLAGALVGVRGILPGAEGRTHRPGGRHARLSRPHASMSRFSPTPAGNCDESATASLDQAPAVAAPRCHHLNLPRTWG